MIQSHRYPRRRAGFTIVEMMVSTALIIFIMYILATAFEKGLTTFRMLKVAGDMQERLRTAATILRTDLSLPHFDVPNWDNSANWDQYVSGQRLDKTKWYPRSKGYFRVDQGARPAIGGVTGVVEGLDADDPSLLQTRALPPATNNQYNHSLQFTVRLPGTRRDQYFTASLAAGTYPLHTYSQPDYTKFSSIPGDDTKLQSYFSTVWAEVGYFVYPLQGQFANGTQLYGLYRRQKLIVDPPAGAPPLSSVTIPLAPPDIRYIDLGFWRRSGATAEISTTDKISAPIRRFGLQQNAVSGLSTYGTGDTSLRPCADVYGTTADQAGIDLLLSNVIDFQVKALWDPAVSDTTKFAAGGRQFATIPGVIPPDTATAVLPINPDYPFDLLPKNAINLQILQLSPDQRVFDTWSSLDDPLTLGGTSGAKYRYTDPTTMVKGVRVDTGILPSDRDNANWNQGHFTSNGNLKGFPQSIPLRVRLRAVQIKIRIWDTKSQQSRQMTIIQDL